MADVTKEMLDGLLAEIKGLKDQVAAQKNAPNKEQFEKQVADLVKSQVDLKTANMEAELRKESSKIRKGVYEFQGEENLASHATVIRKSEDPKIQEFQRWNDDVYIVSKLMKTNPQNLKIWKDNAPLHSDIRKAMDTATANEGLEWMPRELSADLIERVRLALKVASLFPMIDMPTTPYDLPTAGADSVAFLVPETTATDPGSKSFTASDPGTGKVTLTAVKLGARTPFSTESTEDLIIPVIEYIKNRLAIAMANARENAIINGDTTATHQDADVVSSADARKAWMGLRKKTMLNLVVDLSTFTTATLRTMRSNMGKYGADPSKLVYLVSPKTVIKILGIAEVITVDKYGQLATILSGEIAKFDGVPIVVSEFMREDLNSAGVFDVTSSGKGQVLLVYVPAFLQGQKRKLTLKSFEDVERDQSVLVTSWRGAFNSVYDAATEPIVVRGRNVTL